MSSEGQVLLLEGKARGPRQEPRPVVWLVLAREREEALPRQQALDGRLPLPVPVDQVEVLAGVP